MKPKINRKSDQYTPMGYDQCQTPAWALDPLLPYLKTQDVWEPASGEGYLAQALSNAGKSVYATELDTRLKNYVYKPAKTGFNFLTDELVPVFSLPLTIITNPPYSGSLKQDFTIRAYRYYLNYGFPFALLMPVEFIGTASAQNPFKKYGGLQMMYLNARVDFKMPEIGWSGKSTNKMVKRVNKKTGKEEWIRQAGAQFPVAWYCVGFNFPQDIMFGELNPYRMETLENPYVE